MNLLEYYHKVRSHSLQICEPLHVEDYIPQVAGHTSPPKWHLAHTTWFFEEMILKKTDSTYSAFNPQFNFLFNSYYQTIGERAVRDQRGVMTRPLVAEVKEYRAHVDKHMSLLLAKDIEKELADLMF